VSERPPDLIPVVQRSYDLCAELYRQVDRFPRAQRGLIGRVVLDDALRMLSALSTANRRTDKVDDLAEASGRLDAVRASRGEGGQRPTLAGSVNLPGYPDYSLERVYEESQTVCFDCIPSLDRPQRFCR
jgi:hypothetical protein